MTPALQVTTWLAHAIEAFLTPAFLAILAIAAVVSVLLYTEHPQIDQRTVAALVPWVVAASALSVLSTATTYPRVVRAAVTGPGAYLTTYVLIGLVWFAYRQFTRGSRRENGLPLYLAAMGLGVASVLIGAVIVRAGGLSAGQLFWLVIAPVTAAAVAAIVLVLVGLWYPEAAAYTGVAGGVAVFGHALAALGTAVAVVADGGHTILSAAVFDFAATVSTIGIPALSQQLVWAGGFVWLRLVLVILAVLALTTYTQRQPSRGNLALGLVAAVGVAGGVSALLSIVVGV